MNYGVMFSMELQKMAREGRQGVREDAGDAYEQMKNDNYYKSLQNATAAGSGSGNIASRSPVTGTWAVGGAGRTPAQSNAEAQKAKKKVLAKSPNAFTPPAVAQR